MCRSHENILFSWIFSLMNTTCICLQSTCIAMLNKSISYLLVFYFLHTDRVGGRTVSEDLPAANGVDQWDMGGQWVSR